MNRLRPLTFLLCLLVFAASGLAAGPAWAATGAATPEAVVETLHESLLSVMRDAKALGPGGRFDKLSTPVDKALDLEGMIAIAAGDYWSKASASERERLLAAFRDYSVSTYANRFDGYDGEHFETLGEAQGPRGTTLVKTRILGPNTDPVPITYVVRKTEQGWRIVDVLLESGISELASRRSEYRLILKEGGIANLARVLAQKAKDLIAR